MGKGRPRTPDTIKKVRGTIRDDRINHKQPEYPLLLDGGEPPDFIVNEIAVKEWHRIAPLLVRNNVLQEPDVMMLAAYCQEIGTYWECQVKIQNKKGDEKALGYRAHNALNNAMKIASRYGLTPSDRQKIVSNPPDDSGDIMDDFL